MPTMCNMCVIKIPDFKKLAYIALLNKPLNRMS